mgnify:CR=1 FL=1
MRMTKRILTYISIFGMVFIFLTNCSDQKEGEQAEEDSLITDQSDVTDIPEEENSTPAEVTDEELDEVLSVIQELQGSQQRLQMQVMQIIGSSDLGMQKFQAITQARRETNNQPQGFSAEELQAYKEIAGKLDQLQQTFRKEAEEVVSAKGMTMQRYEEIGRAIQSDSVLQQKFQQKMMELQMQMQKQFQQQEGQQQGQEQEEQEQEQQQQYQQQYQQEQQKQQQEQEDKKQQKKEQQQQQDQEQNEEKKQQKKQQQQEEGKKQKK